MLLAPLRRAFRRHGAYLLPLPSADVRPGSTLTSRGELFQDLLEVGALWPGAEPGQPSVEESAASFLVDRTEFVAAGGGRLGAGVPQLGSAQLLLEGSRRVLVEVRGVSLRRAAWFGEVEHAADWLVRLNRHLDDPELGPVLDLLRRRRRGLVAPRALDLVEATVHVQQLVFTTDGDGAAELGVEVERLAQVDVDAGFDVQWSRSAELVWTAGDVPIAFLPVRYAWSRRGRLVPALL